MIVDMHTHIVPEEFPDCAGRASGYAWPHLEPEGDGSSTLSVVRCLT